MRMRKVHAAVSNLRQVDSVHDVGKNYSTESCPTMEGDLRLSSVRWHKLERCGNKRTANKKALYTKLRAYLSRQCLCFVYLPR